MEGVAFVFIFFAIIVITALLFGVWVVFSIIRLLFRGLVSLAAPAPQRAITQHIPIQQSADLHRDLHMVRCANAKCRHSNPSTAQFCRQCGNAMPGVQRVSVQRTQTGYTRRVAMW